ncbi:metal ABC transporter substrate-binding protein [Paenibacillus doosanensis]|uniref:High-affinity zinc uptake system binding-protein ZnuA n=1 Tax=Paenibacillus konkukensis TaxID=2020716 RepID=A0ABY4RVL8_9BACL|nr:MULTISPECIES: metal ABC transporter substrate-binding protein [Paenibacillus]MCS7464962.1 metal ABC transporter substrate-binding protein [Paenibacillus doosanensis]UQZ86367.1 High-affinity zinc uptake system binding-protein ZnuA precursor [Paenibacillus konkukensis]
MKSLVKQSLGLLLASSLVLAAGCSSAEPKTAPAAAGGQTAPQSAADTSSKPAAATKLKIVTSFYPLYEFSRQVAGDKADVVNLIPGGVEPHDWEPTAQDMKQIQDAGIFVYNGAGMESWADKALDSLKKEQTAVVEASKGIELMEGVEEEDEDDHDHGKEHASAEGPVLDPHIWLDPVLAQKEVQAIQDALEKADPANKETYKKNADAYIAKLQQLDKAFKDGLSGAKHKEFVTQHAAFGYLAKRYGLTQVPIAGLSPEQEPSPGKLGEIVQFAKEKQVKTIFFETLVAPKVAETVAKELGAKTAVLNPIEGLTDDDKAKNLDYIGIMQNNLAALQSALNE